MIITSALEVQPAFNFARCWSYYSSVGCGSSCSTQSKAINKFPSNRFLSRFFFYFLSSTHSVSVPLSSFVFYPPPPLFLTHIPSFACFQPNNSEVGYTCFSCSTVRVFGWYFKYAINICWAAGLLSSPDSIKMRWAAGLLAPLTVLSCVDLQVCWHSLTIFWCFDLWACCHPWQ
jgi:hypothetical protein